MPVRRRRLSRKQHLRKRSKKQSRKQSSKRKKKLLGFAHHISNGDIQLGRSENNKSENNKNKNKKLAQDLFSEGLKQLNMVKVINLDNLKSKVRELSQHYQFGKLMPGLEKVFLVKIESIFEDLSNKNKLTGGFIIGRGGITPGRGFAMSRSESTGNELRALAALGIVLGGMVALGALFTWAYYPE